MFPCRTDAKGRDRPDRYSAHPSPAAPAPAESLLALQAPRPGHFRGVAVPRVPAGSRGGPAACPLPADSRRTHLFRGGGAWAHGRRRQSGSRLGRPALAAPRGHGSARALSPLCLSRGRRRGPGLTGSEGCERVSSRGPGPRPGPWEGSGALGAASPRVGCGRPLAGAPRAHSPAPGAGRGRRCARFRDAAFGSARWRCARLAAGLGPGCRAGLRRSSPRALALRCARGSPDRGRPLAGSLARSGLAAAGGTGRSEPRGERRQLAARGRHLHSAAPPRPPRPAPPPGRDPPGRRPAPAPPVRGLGWGLGGGGGRPRQGRLICAPHPRPGFAGGAPAPPRLCLSVDTPRTPRPVFTRALNSQAGRASAPGSNEPELTCAPPVVSLLVTRGGPRLA